tara:strand:+ start:275 stop:1477 length:1203 start_codon:yes stop_codon:yes gene_type:complete
MDPKKFILINLNQNISKARQAAYKDNRDRWIIFGMLCFGFLALTGWFFNINNEYNKLIEAREETIEDIKQKTKQLQDKVEINLSKKNIISAYELGEGYIPWSKKLKQLSELTPPDMCITKLNYSNNKLTITCDSKILETKKPNEKTIAAKFESALQADEDFNIEFDGISLTNVKRITKSNPHDQFIITAKLIKEKNRENRLDDIPIPKKNPIKKKKKKVVPQVPKKNQITEKKEVKNSTIEKKIKAKNDSKYSKAIIDAAQRINTISPEDNPIEIQRFQEVAGISQEGDADYGKWTSETQKFHLAVKESLKADKPNSSDPSKKKSKIKKKSKEAKSKLKYSAWAIEAASKIDAAVPWQDPIAIQNFQEAVGIAQEGDANYGEWTEQTSKIWFDVKREARK